MPTTSKLIPMDVAARVVGAPTSVPLLTDAPFAVSGVLEKGIHVHWALPDVMTRAVASRDHLPRFRGVPDLWLVVRFNPVNGSAKRTYRAWVVDSIAQIVLPLADWTPPDERALAEIHTAPGVIRRVSAGWGEWDSQTPFDALTTAYYPACRTRLGFYDDLSDLANVQTGKVSYTVVGWYSRIEFDPFYNEGFRRRDFVGPRVDIRVNKLVTTAVAKSALDVPLQWNVEMQTQSAPKPKRAEATALKTAARIQATAFKSQARAVDGLIAAVPLEPGSPQHTVVDSVMPDSVQTYTVCHGSVMDVPLRDLTLVGASVTDDKVFLYPNVQRAMAEVASRSVEEQKTDWLDMMLGNLGQQSGSTAGVVDLPGAQHARTFQSAPGKTTFYARLEIHPPLVKATTAFQLADLTNGAPTMTSGHWPELKARSAAAHVAKVAKIIPVAALNQPPAPPAGPTDAEIVAWIEKLRTDFAAARQQSAAAGKPLDDRLIRVEDHRKNAQPTALGRSIDGSGPDQAGWWIDMGDENAPIDVVNDPLHAALADLRRAVAGARVYMPEASNLFEVPGPRWYRPWAPHLVIFGAKRSYRHGSDGRFRVDGHLFTRVSGETMLGLRVGTVTVLAKDLVSSTADVASHGLPSVAQALLHEHLLSDAENAPIMAKQARRPAAGAGTRVTTAQMTAASRALWLSRGNLLKPEEKSAIDLIAPVGTPGSAAGLQAWRNWYGPCSSTPSTPTAERRSTPRGNYRPSSSRSSTAAPPSRPTESR